MSRAGRAGIIFLAFFFLVLHLFAVPAGAAWNDVSEFLIGRVLVKVFFLESAAHSADSEDWSEEEKRGCRAALERALAELRRRFVREFEVEAGSGRLPPGVSLEFIYDYETVEVSVEPITLNGSGIAFSTGDLRLWVNEVMARKGFADKTPPEGLQPLLPFPPYQYNVARYADHLRRKLATDWATVIFFYDNSADADGEFANGKSAGPPMGVGGPGLHFPSRLGGQAEATAGIIHEFLHLWYAVDEHTMNRHFREDALSGYLAGGNRNYALASGYPCVMYSVRHWPEICKFTKKQIGWTDSDGDRIPDILDVPPRLEGLKRIEAGNNGTVAFQARAVSPPLPNRNPYSEGGTIKPPYDLSVVLHLAPVAASREKLFRRRPGFSPPFPWQRNDITINRIAAVEYRLLREGVALSGWIAARPADGAFDEAVEEFEIILESPAAGACTLEIRSRNSAGLLSDTSRIAFTVQ